MNNQYCNPKYQSVYLQWNLYQYQCAYDRDHNPHTKSQRRSIIYYNI